MVNARNIRVHEGYARYDFSPLLPLAHNIDHHVKTLVIRWTILVISRHMTAGPGILQEQFLPVTTPELVTLITIKTIIVHYHLIVNARNIRTYDC